MLAMKFWKLFQNLGIWKRLFFLMHVDELNKNLFKFKLNRDLWNYYADALVCERVK